MSLAIFFLFHFLCAQHVSDNNNNNIYLLQLGCHPELATVLLNYTSVVLFCKDGAFSVSVNLWCLVVCIWCDVHCLFIVVSHVMGTLHMASHHCLFVCIHMSTSVQTAVAEKLTGFQLTNKFLYCLEPELSLPYIMVKNKIEILRSLK